MKYLKHIIQSLPAARDSPERVAGAFSIGVFLAFSPLVGLHTLLALAVARLLRLNKVVAVLGSWANMPWIMVPYYSLATWFGVLLTGLPAGASLPDVGASSFFTADFWMWLFSQWRFLIPAAVGSTILALLLSGLSYPIVLAMVRGYRASRGADRSGPSASIG